MNETFCDVTVVNLQDSTSDDEPYRARLTKDVDGMQNSSALLSRTNGSECSLEGKSHDQDYTFQYCNTQLKEDSNISSNSMPSLERKPECLDLQLLVKDLETRNRELSEENEKLLNKLSLQTKVLLQCTHKLIDKPITW